MTAVTVQGGTGFATQSIDFPTADALALAQQIAPLINGMAAGNVTTFGAGGNQFLASTITGVVVDGTGATTVVGTSASLDVLSGTGGLTFFAPAGSNFELSAAGGSNSISSGTGSSFVIVTGAGNDLIYASGSGSVDAGAGQNTILGGAGALTITSYGTGDLIALGSGAATVGERGSSGLVFMGSGSAVIADTGTADTITGGTGAATMYGGVGGTYFLTSASNLFVSSNAANGSATIVGTNGGTETVFGGTRDVIFANSSSLTYVGNNATATISGGSGNDSVFASNGSNITYYGASGTAVLDAGSGSNTINAAPSTIGSEFIVGSGNAFLIGGSGNDTFFGGAGSSTFVGGSGTDLFSFIRGSAGGTEVISNFTSKDAVYLTNYGAGEAASDVATETTAGNATTITLSDNTKITFLGVSQLYATGSDIITSACFCTGTRIATAGGETAIEDLREGDLVRTHNGALRAVRWIGHHHHAAPSAAQMPVRVRADSFADGQPHRDLYLSQDHAIFAEGVLIPSRALVDGGAVSVVEVADVAYFHILLDSHDVILAEGLPCESYLDTDDFARFDTAPGGHRNLHFSVACAPIVQQGHQVEAVRRRLRRRALVSA